MSGSRLVRWAAANAGNWLSYAVVLFAGLTLLRVLAFWTIAHYRLLGAYMDNQHPTLASTLADAIYIYPLDLELRGVFVVPILLLLLPLALRLPRPWFTLGAVVLLAVATAPILLFEPGPLSFQVFSFGAAVLTGLLLPKRYRAST
jgi:hypothetical protein